MPDVVDKVLDLELRVKSRFEQVRAKTLSAEEVAEIVAVGRDCSECGLPIPVTRLKVNPYAHRCIHCQERKER